MPRLICHPQSPCQAVTAIEVDAARPAPGELALTYALACRPDSLVVPPPAPPLRADGLWRHTCFEAFLRAPEAEAYVELNLAPSGQWAAYRFEGYRAGMAPLDIPPPRIAWRATAEGFELRAHLDLRGVAEPAPGAAWRVALTAVIEAAEGGAGYWALAHPPGKADFHARDGFALILPGPDPART